MFERLPDDRPDHERGFGIIVLVGRTQSAIVPSADFLLAPLVAADVDEDPHEPGLFVLPSLWNGFRCPRSLEERLLNQVERIVDGRRQTTCQAIQPFVMCVE